MGMVWRILSISFFPSLFFLSYGEQASDNTKAMMKKQILKLPFSRRIDRVAVKI